MWNRSNIESSAHHLCHLPRYFSGMSSSGQSRCSLRQRSCSSFFAESVKEAMKPRGSKIDETVDKTPRLINGLLLRTIRNPKLSDCMHHCIPKARSTRRLSHSRAMDLTSLDRSSTGIDSRTARRLEVNLVRGIHLSYKIDEDLRDDRWIDGSPCCSL